MLAAVADFYERVEEKERATELLRRLAERGADPRTWSISAIATASKATRRRR